MLLGEDHAIDGLGSLAQPTRLAAFRQLLAAHPESLPAGEIARLCEVPHNTMSTHLGILSRAGLIAVERQGRVMNYRADVRAFRGLLRFLTRDCCNGRPDLCGDLARLLPEETEEHRGERHDRRIQRSVPLHAQLGPIDHGRGPAGQDRQEQFRAYSAGSDPATEPMPEVIARLKVLGHDVTKLRCKSWNEFTGPDAPRMDFVIALCDTLHGQFCPELGEKFVTGCMAASGPCQIHRLANGAHDAAE